MKIRRHFTRIMAILFAVVVIMMVGTAMAESQPAKDSMTREQRIAMANARRAAAIARLGGFIQAPVTGLVVRIVNQQRIVPEEAIRACIGKIQSFIHYGIEIVGTEPSDGRTAARVELVEEGDAPTLLIAPEDKWGRLNVSRLASDSPNTDTLRLRFEKELWRCYCMTLGASNSNYSPCVMHTVFSLADLDGDISRMACPEVQDKVQRVCRKLKVDFTRLVTYKKACIEGWAPAPTNDVQKAIWEQVKADKERGPTNPIRIEPPKKK